MHVLVQYVTEVDDEFRRALWWRANAARTSKDPSKCPKASRDDVKEHLRNCGKLLDDDVRWEWQKACERYKEEHSNG